MAGQTRRYSASDPFFSNLLSQGSDRRHLMDQLFSDRVRARLEMSDWARRPGQVPSWR
jgi:hypothetical protein